MAKVSAAGLPRRGRETALGFRLEEQLPLAIEELTADFVEDAEVCLGVAVETKKIAAIVDSLESRGISVTSICPAALLIAQYLASEDADAVLIFQQNHVDFVCLKNSVIRDWTCLPPQADALDRQMHYMKLGALRHSARSASLYPSICVHPIWPFDCIPARIRRKWPRWRLQNV